MHKTPLIRLLFALLFALLIAACDKQQPPTISNGTPAPAFTLERLDGQRAEFPQQYQGQIVVLRFWADWCRYCHSEMRDLETLYGQYRERGVVMLAVNVMQPHATVQKFVEQLGISYPILLDQDGAVMRQYRVLGLPVTYLIDRQGAVRGRIIGESTPQVLCQAIERLIAN